MIKANDTYNFHKHFPKPSAGRGKEYPILLERVPNDHYSLLDFGCGKGGTIEYVKLNLPKVYVAGYDPFVAEYNRSEHLDRLWDYTFSGDTLEHIEEEHIPHVLETLNSITRNSSIHVIDLDPADKTFPDGRNAHLALLSPEVWLDHFERAGLMVKDYRVDVWNTSRHLTLEAYATGTYDTDG